MPRKYGSFKFYGLVAAAALSFGLGISIGKNFFGGGAKERGAQTARASDRSVAFKHTNQFSGLENINDLPPLEDTSGWMNLLQGPVSAITFGKQEVLEHFLSAFVLARQPKSAGEIENLSFEIEALVERLQSHPEWQHEIWFNAGMVTGPASLVNSAAALEYARNLPASNLPARSQLLAFGAIVRAQSGISPASGWRIAADALIPDELRLSLKADALATLALADGAKIQSYLDELDTGESDEVLRSLVDNYPGEDLSKLLRWYPVSAWPEDLRARGLRKLMLAGDEEAAIEQWASLPASERPMLGKYPVSKSVAQAILKGMVDEGYIPQPIEILRLTESTGDAAKVIESIESAGTSEGKRAELMSEVVKAVAKTDVEEALKLLGAHNDVFASLTSAGRESLFSQMGKHTSHVDNALRNIEGISDAQDRLHFVKGFLESDRTELKSAALRFQDILSVVEPGKELNLDSAIQSFTDRLTQMDPGFAIGWSGSLNSELAARSRNHIAQTWVELDPPTASKWMAARESSDFSDETISKLVQNITDDPIGKISWAGAVTDPDLKYQLQRSALELSYLRNPEQFEQMLSYVSDPIARERLRVEITPQ